MQKSWKGTRPCASSFKKRETPWRQRYSADRRNSTELWRHMWLQEWKKQPTDLCILHPMVPYGMLTRNVKHWRGQLLLEWPDDLAKFVRTLLHLEFKKGEIRNVLARSFEDRSPSRASTEWGLYSLCLSLHYRCEFRSTQLDCTIEAWSWQVWYVPDPIGPIPTRQGGTGVYLDGYAIGA